MNYEILLVEDDEFKALDLVRLVMDMFPESYITRAHSVTSALKCLTDRPFNLVILDMSLPTFDLSGPGGGGSPQGQGGIEALRVSKRLGRTSPIIIVTQYPDIELDGHEIPLGAAASLLSARFEMDVRKCIAYGFDSDDWRTELADAIKPILGSNSEENLQ